MSMLMASLTSVPSLDLSRTSRSASASISTSVLDLLHTSQDRDHALVTSKSMSEF